MEVDLQLEDQVEHKVHRKSRDHVQKNEVQDPEPILHVEVRYVVHDALVVYVKNNLVNVVYQKPNAHVDVLDDVLVVAQSRNKDLKR